MKCWLLRFTLIEKYGNGYAIVIAKDPKTAQNVLTRQGRIAEVGYRVHSVEPFTAIQINPCFTSNIIIAEGLVSEGQPGTDGVGIEDIIYDEDRRLLTFLLSDGRREVFDISTNINVSALTFQDIKDIIEIEYNN